MQITIDGVHSFELVEGVEAKQFKVHSKFDERNEDGEMIDNGLFRNLLGGIIRAEEELTHATISYGYDEVGNRTYERITKALLHSKEYRYYANSNLLLTDGTYAFVYDADGNLIKKGITFVLDGEEVIFATGGKGVEYWEYGYNLRNQLKEVRKNGQSVADYTYDGLGLRVSATTTITSNVTGQSKTTTRDYVFDLADRVIYDKVIFTIGELPADEDPETATENSYVFARGLHFAKIEGAIGNVAEVFYYHNDRLGSPMAVTDASGNLAWCQDYLPYGEVLNETAISTKTRFTFTGKEYDAASGLYYYNSRWYDADLGRFISEDTYAGDPNEPRSLNRYVYTRGNPLKYLDPTGHDIIIVTDRSRVGHKGHTFVVVTLPDGSGKAYSWGAVEMNGMEKAQFVSSSSIGGGDTTPKPISKECMGSPVKLFAELDNSGYFDDDFRDFKGKPDIMFNRIPLNDQLTEEAERQLNSNYQNKDTYDLWNYNCADFSLEGTGKSTFMVPKPSAGPVTIPNKLENQLAKSFGEFGYLSDSWSNYWTSDEPSYYGNDENGFFEKAWEKIKDLFEGDNDED